MQRLEVSGAVRPLYGSLGVKGLRLAYDKKQMSLIGNILEKTVLIWWKAKCEQATMEQTKIMIRHCYYSSLHTGKAAD